MAGGNVYIEYRAKGKRRQKLIGPDGTRQRREADQILQNAVKRARADYEGWREAGDLSIAQVFTQYMDDAKHRRSPKTGGPLSPVTLANYRQWEQMALQRIDGARQALSLRKRDIREWINDLRQAGLKERTIAGIIDYVKQVYRWAAGDGDILPYDPITGVKNASHKTEVRAYSRNEISRLLDAITELDRGRAWRFRLLALCHVAYGARANQIIRLQWTDVDLDNGTVTFRQDVLGSKRQPDRTLPMPGKVRDGFVAAWNHRVEVPWVLWNWQDASRHVRYDSMNQRLHILEEQAGVEWVKGRAFHAFRRSLATLIVERAGVNQAAAFIGDTPEVILRVYSKPTKEAQSEAMDVVEALLG